MSSEWVSGTLGDILTLQRGMDLPVQERKSGRVPIVASNGITGFHDHAPVKGPGVLIGRSGSIGGGQYIKEDFWPLNTTLWVKDFKGNDPRFCYFLLRSIDFSSLNAGSGVPTLNRNHLHPIPLACPQLKEQAQISELLGSLDDRISLLRETNTTLEAIAQALFKSWFVDFDPVRAKQQGNDPQGMDAATAALFPDSFEESEQGLVPKGWEVGTIGDISKNNSESFDFSKTDKVVFVNTGDVLDGEFLHKNYSSKDGLPGQAKKAIFENDILFSEIRPKNGRFAYVNFDPSDYVVSTKFMVLRAINNIPPKYLYQILRQTETIEYFNVIAESRSGTFPQITFDSIKSYKLIKPSAACLAKYVDCTSSIFSKIDLLNKQAQTLATLRDTLLPRLISGQLRLSV